jgi:hypothetical protein
MARLTLRLEALEVASFPAVSAPTDPSATCETNDYSCLTLTLLREDCIGPTAGCTNTQ